MSSDLEDRRMMAGDLDGSANDGSVANDESYAIAVFSRTFHNGAVDDGVIDSYERAHSKNLIGPYGGAVSFAAKQQIIQDVKEGTAVSNASHRGGKRY